MAIVVIAAEARDDTLSSGLARRGWSERALPAAPPRAEAIRDLLAREGTQASEVVVVGVHPEHVAAAHACGAAAIGVEWGGGSRTALEPAGADWLCTSPEQVLQRLAGWLDAELPAPRERLLTMRRSPRQRPRRIERPEPGQLSVWDFPRPPRLVDARESLRVEHAGDTLASSRNGLAVQETAGPPTWYLPPEDVAPAALEPCAGRSLCEWKGLAHYWRLRGGDRAVAWSYPAPLPGYERLAHHLAFFAGRVDACYVGEKRALPQPGGYYGGWVTPDVTGPFKGLPGSERW